MRSLLNFLHFFSMYSRMVLIMRIMAMMRLPNAIVPKWKTWRLSILSRERLKLSLEKIETYRSIPYGRAQGAAGHIGLVVWPVPLRKTFSDLGWGWFVDMMVIFSKLWPQQILDIMCIFEECSPLQRLRPGQARQRLWRRRGPSRGQRRWSSGSKQN